MFDLNAASALPPNLRAAFTDVCGQITAFLERQHTPEGVLTLTADGLDSVPVGTIVLWPAATQLPTRWLACNGQQINKARYAALYKVVGVLYGTSGDAFTLPTLAGPVSGGVTLAYIIAAGTT